MKVRASDGLTLDLSERGEGPPVLLVHGLGGSGASWGEAALTGLARRHRVLAVDLPGHGASADPTDSSRVSLDRVLDDLERALDTAGVSSCPWIGYSMGGRIALGGAILRAHRLTKMVLESASPGLPTEQERETRRAEDEALARGIEERGIEAWIDSWERSPLFAGRARLAPPERAAFLVQRRGNRAASLAAWLQALGTGSQPSFWSRLGEVRIPTLLVSGARDPKFTAIAHLMSEAIPDVRCLNVTDAGHTVHLECPADWLGAVVPFLDRPS